eukprot:8221030-Alexandrium_andersonii.AAC.1
MPTRRRLRAQTQEAQQQAAAPQSSWPSSRLGRARGRPGKRSALRAGPALRRAATALCAAPGATSSRRARTAASQRQQRPTP